MRVALPTGKRLQKLAPHLVKFLNPKNENHFVDLVVRREKFAGRVHRDLRRGLDRIAVGAATDRRKRDGLDSVFHCKLQ